MTPIPKEDALEACETCPKKVIDKRCMYLDIKNSKGDIHNPPECLIFQFKQISEREHPHPIVSDGKQTEQKKETNQLTTVQERYIAETLESWEKKQEVIANSSGNDGVQKGGHGGVMLEAKTTKNTISKGGSSSKHTDLTQKTSKNTISKVGSCKQASVEGGSSKSQSVGWGHVEANNTTPPSRNEHREIAWLNDQLTQKIMTAIAMRYNKKGIIRYSGAKDGTVKNRLKQLEAHGYIKPHEESIGGIKVIIYSITPKWGHALIHNESSSETGVWAQSAHAEGFRYDESHGNTFKFKLLENGALIISQLSDGIGRKYKMKNWEGKVFESEDGSWFIRTTPQNIIVYVNHDLGSDTPQNLMLKYADKAKEIALIFSERYKVPVASVPKWYRDPHFTIKDNHLAGIVQNALGTVETENFGIDKSRSNGDFEAKKSDAATGLAFTISDMPQVAQRMEGGLKSLSDNLTTKFKELNIMLALMHDNQIKDEKIKDLTIKLEKFTQKFEEIQGQFEEFKKRMEPESKPLDYGSKIMYG